MKALNEIKASLGWRVVYAWVGDDPCGDGDLPPWSGVTCSTVSGSDYRVVTELWVSVSFALLLSNFFYSCAYCFTIIGGKVSNYWIIILLFSYFFFSHFCLAGKYMQFLLLVLFHLQLPIWWILSDCMIILYFILVSSVQFLFISLKQELLFYFILPFCISKISKAISFGRDLHNNKLTGPIPSQIGRLKHLKILYSPVLSHRWTICSLFVSDTCGIWLVNHSS